MVEERLRIEYEAGEVNGIEVVVVTKVGSPECLVQLHGTFEGVSDIGEPFVGEGAKRKAAVFAESIYAALVCADITWRA